MDEHLTPVPEPVTPASLSASPLAWPAAKPVHAPQPVRWAHREDGSTFCAVTPGQQFINPKRQARKRAERLAQELYGRPLTKRERHALRRRLRRPAS